MARARFGSHPAGRLPGCRPALFPPARSAIGGRSVFRAWTAWRAVLHLILAAGAALPVAPGQTLTQADLLRRLIDLERLTFPPQEGESRGTVVLPSPHPGASTGAAQDPQSWRTWADLAGPGVITRLWVSQPSGELRLEIDGQPAMEAELARLFDGQRPPFGPPLGYQTTEGGGWLCQFPIGFAQSCRVQVRQFEGDGELTYVSLPSGAQVRSFDPGLDDAARQALEAVSTALRNGLSDRQLLGGRPTETVAAEETLGKGQRLTVDVPGGGIIRSLRILLPGATLPRAPYALHRIVLRGWWDGQSRPAIEVPLIDFFGSGFGWVAHRSLVSGTSHWDYVVEERTEDVAQETRYLYFNLPMPFEHGARFEIESLDAGAKPLPVVLYLRVDRKTSPAGRLRLHARFRAEHPCRWPGYLLVDAGGPGRFVGFVLNVDTPTEQWWTQPLTPAALVDDTPPWAPWAAGLGGLVGDTTPWHGLALALHGITRTGPYSKSSAYRWLLSDDIPFRRSLRLMLGGAQTGRPPIRDLYASTIAFWYAAPDAPDGFRPVRSDDLTPPGLRIPDSVEIEGRATGNAVKSVIREQDEAPVEFSGGRAVALGAGEEAAVRIPSAQARRVQLFLRVHPRRPFGTIDVRDESGRLIGTVRYVRGSEGIYEVGPLELRAGETTLRVTGSRATVLDCWILRDQP